MGKIINWIKLKNISLFQYIRISVTLIYLLFKCLKGNDIKVKITMKYIKILCMVLLFQSCNTTTLSDKEASNLSSFKVEIHIKDTFDPQGLDKIYAYVSNGKKRIINENIKIILNGKPLKLYVRTGNYYDKHPEYQAEELARQAAYYFEIQLADSTIHPLAFIKPRKLTADFSFPEQLSIDKDFVLEWKNNTVSANVDIWKGVHQKDKPNMHSGGPYAASTLHHTINTKEGSYKVPKSFYTDSLTVADYLKVKINSVESGLMHPKLIPNSKITYSYRIEKSVDIEE